MLTGASTLAMLSEHQWQEKIMVHQDWYLIFQFVLEIRDPAFQQIEFAQAGTSGRLSQPRPMDEQEVGHGYPGEERESS